MEGYLSNGECGCLGHFSVRTEECVTLESLVLARGDEGKHTVVRCVRGAIGDPEFSLFVSISFPINIHLYIEKSRFAELVTMVSILIPLKEMVSATLSSFLSCFFTIALIVLIALLVDSSPVGWSTRLLPRYLMTRNVATLMTFMNEDKHVK